MIPARLLGKNVRTLVNSATGLSIPVIASRGMVFSAWTPSKEELSLLQDGKPVWLIQRGAHIPEMVMSVGEEQFVVPKDVRDEMLYGSKELDMEKALSKPAGDDFSKRWALVLSVLLLSFVTFSVTAGSYIIFRYLKIFFWK